MNVPHEATAEVRASARAMHELLETFTQAGFTEEQAFALVAIAWQTSIAGREQQ